MDDKRIKILNAVIDIIKTDGINSGIKMSTIATKADIGKGTIYEYFKNKDAVITETLIYLIDLGKQNILFDTSNLSLNFEDTLSYFIERLLKSITRNGSLYNLFAHQKIGNILNEEMKLKIHQKMIEMKHEFRVLFKEILELGIKENKIPTNYDQFESKCAITTLLTCTMEFVQEHHPRQLDENKKNIFITKLTSLTIKMVK
ncbi:TetR/AcrR family transcriptional regulator [Haloplasma contractile]|uniref:Transcriptional regulator TetR-AcrR family protein n=1 Tax=Haloplasma contractile SSD-17B TaxID=1033810 RepID=F7PWK3_9MOLU|nr:TetR/AcrR family transcriptional regulator [Haloplasma contractile]ERJ12629.1 Transcriptional regulator TetR-AcrR family protein [Haloplasma contractile SSD-17B]